MGAPSEVPEPDESQFAPGGSLLVRPRPVGLATKLSVARAPPPRAAAPAGAPDAPPRAADQAPAAAAGAPPGAIPLDGGLGATVDFETDLFAGRMRVVFKLPGEQQHPEVAAMLAGKKRQMWVMIQGRVKRAVPLDDLQYGSFYSRPLRFPAPLILGPALHWLSARLGSTLHMQLRGSEPHVIGPLCAAVQMLNVSRVGREPDLVAAQEDTRLLFRADGEGDPMPSNKRRSYFKRSAHRAGKAFTPDRVITLHCYDHSFNYDTFRMSVPPCFQLDMVKVLDAQPVDVSLRDKRTGQWAFRFEVWHRRMLAHLQRKRERAASGKGARRRGGGGDDSDWSDDDELSGGAVAGGGAGGGGSGAVEDPAELARRLEAQAAIAAHRISFEASEDDDDDGGDDDDEDSGSAGGGVRGARGGGVGGGVRGAAGASGPPAGDEASSEAGSSSAGGAAGGGGSSVVSTATASSGAVTSDSAAGL